MNGDWANCKALCYKVCHVYFLFILMRSCELASTLKSQGTTADWGFIKVYSVWLISYVIFPLINILTLSENWSGTLFLFRLSKEGISTSLDDWSYAYTVIPTWIIASSFPGVFLSAYISLNKNPLKTGTLSVWPTSAI